MKLFKDISHIRIKVVWDFKKEKSLRKIKNLARLTIKNRFKAMKDN
jgi:hypothetical protein